MEAGLVSGKYFLVAAPRRLDASDDEGLALTWDLVSVEHAGLAQAEVRGEVEPREDDLRRGE